MKIDRCQCYEVPFDELLNLAKRIGASTIAELQLNRDFGLQCKLCHPYVRRMLRTGETSFDRIVTDQDEPPADDIIARR